MVNRATSNHDFRSLFDRPKFTINGAASIWMIRLTGASLIKPQFFMMSELSQWKRSFEILLSIEGQWVIARGKLLAKFVPPSCWRTSTCLHVTRPIWRRVSRLQSSVCMTRPIWRRASRFAALLQHDSANLEIRLPAHHRSRSFVLPCSTSAPT